MDSAQLSMACIEIYKYKDRESDYGIYADDLTFVYKTRASVRLDSQNIEVNNGEVYFPITSTFYVRAYVPVEDNSVIKYNNRYWRVLSALPDKYYNNIVVRAELLND